MCIVSIVFLHCQVWQRYLGSHYDLIVHVEVPVFMMVSGMMYKFYGGLVRTIMRRIDQLLVPLMFFLVAYIIVVHTLRSVGSSTATTGWFFYDDGIRFNILSIWFLPTLFWQLAMFSIIDKYVATPLGKMWSVVVVAVAGSILSHKTFHFTGYIDTAMTMMPYFYLGYCLKGSKITSKEYSSDVKMLIFASVMAVAAYLIGRINHGAIPNHAANIYSGNILLHHLESIVGSISLLIFVRKIAFLPILNYLGRYSIVVLGFHRIFINLLSYVGISYDQPLLLAVATLALCIVAIKPVTKYLPWFTAQRGLLVR